jgi:hypothetical protein
MFDSQEAYQVSGERFDGLTRGEVEQRPALIRELGEWLDEREARTRGVLAAIEAGK